MPIEPGRVAITKRPAEEKVKKIAMKDNILVIPDDTNEPDQAKAKPEKKQRQKTLKIRFTISYTDALDKDVKKVPGVGCLPVAIRRLYLRAALEGMDHPDIIRVVECFREKKQSQKKDGEADQE